jgi:hypothetical protein
MLLIGIVIGITWLLAMAAAGYFWTRYDVFIEDKLGDKGFGKYSKQNREKNLPLQIYAISAILAMTLFFGLWGSLPATITILTMTGLLYYSTFNFIFEKGVKEQIIDDLSDPRRLFVDGIPEGGTVNRWTVYASFLAYPSFLTLISIIGLMLHPFIPTAF